jgi:hypothetical protein
MQGMSRWYLVLPSASRLSFPIPHEAFHDDDFDIDDDHSIPLIIFGQFDIRSEGPDR